MRTLLIGLATLPLLASIASAAEPLGDSQMDRVVAAGIDGQTPLPPLSLPPLQCASPSCASPVNHGNATPIPIGLPFSEIVANFVAQVIANGYPQ